MSHERNDIILTPEWMDHRIPSYGRSLKSGINMLVKLTSILDKNDPVGSSMIPVAKWSNCYAQLCCAFGLIRYCLRKMLGALEDKRYSEIVRETQNTFLVTKPLTNIGFTEDGSVVVSAECIRALGEAVQQSLCSLCDGDPETVRKCKYRKCVKEISFVDDHPDEKKFGMCLGQIMNWKRE